MTAFKHIFIVQDLFLLPAVLLVYYLCHRLTRREIALDKLPGPKSTSFLYGNLRELLRLQVGQTEFPWYKEHGSVIRVNTPFGGYMLLLSDPKALHHIFQVAGYQYPRARVRRLLGETTSGHSLINVEAEDHRRQRRLMQPGFGINESRALVPIFLSCAAKMTTKWSDLLNESANDYIVLDLPSWASRATLDAIGLAAFNYEFGALDNADNELSRGFRNLFKDVFGLPSNEAILTMSIFQYLPTRLVRSFFRIIRSARIQRLRQSSEVSRKVSKVLIEQKEEALLSGEVNKDVLSLIVKANASENPKARLADDEMHSLMRLFTIAGHETTANTLGWTALELSKCPDVQATLRQEIRATRLKVQERGDREFIAADFDSMPYLTAVVKEVLRMHPAAPSMDREAAGDDVIPLSKPITLTDGEVVNELFIPKGTKITASIATYNRIPEIFGEDAHTFNPDRWLKSEDTKKGLSIGVYGNLFTFSGGHKSCLGWRFAVLELQSFLVNIFGDFELSLAVPPEKIRREACAVMVPTIEGEAEKGGQLPVRIKIAN